MEVPARYSAADDAAKPLGQRIAPRLWITLDGLPVSRVISYDIERGEIVRMVIDRFGNPLVNPRQRDEWLTQTIRGKVRVEWHDA